MVYHPTYLVNSSRNSSVSPPAGPPSATAGDAAGRRGVADAPRCRGGGPSGGRLRRGCSASVKRTHRGEEESGHISVNWRIWSQGYDFKISMGSMDLFEDH